MPKVRTPFVAVWLVIIAALVVVGCGREPKEPTRVSFESMVVMEGSYSTVDQHWSPVGLRLAYQSSESDVTSFTVAEYPQFVVGATEELVEGRWRDGLIHLADSNAEWIRPIEGTLEGYWPELSRNDLLMAFHAPTTPPSIHVGRVVIER